MVSRLCSFLFTQNFLTLGIVLVNIGYSDQQILSVNRRADGDTIQVQTTLFCNSMCVKYDAEKTTSGLGLNSCLCKCRGNILQPTRTFYDKDSKCRKDSDIAKASK